MFNFKWQPVSNGIKYDHLGDKKHKTDGYGIGNNMNSFNTTMGGGPLDANAAPTISDLNAR
jgi:hypothetical protein